MTTARAPLSLLMCSVWSLPSVNGTAVSARVVTYSAVAV